MVTQIIPQMTIGDLKRIPALKEVADILVIKYPELGDERSLEEIGSEDRYDTESLILGVQRLLDMSLQGLQLNFPLYTKEEIAECPNRKHAALTFFRGTPGAPYIILCSGGGYVILTNISEGFPTAAHFNSLGYNVFVVTYRVDDSPIFPKPQKDVAAAVRYVERNAEALQVQAGHYAIGGFSAGGHLAASWGTEKMGFRHYNLPRPEAIFLCYSATSIAVAAKSEDPFCEIALKGILGNDYTEEDINKYSIENLVDDQFPPTYMWHCKDDDTISFEAATLMGKALKDNGVPYKLKAVEHGGHGRGLALHSEAEGWVEEFIEFWKGEIEK